MNSSPTSIGCNGPDRSGDYLELVAWPADKLRPKFQRYLW